MQRIDPEEESSERRNKLKKSSSVFFMKQQVLMEKELRENRGGEIKKEEDHIDMGMPIHSQIKKIKQEYEKIKDPSPDSPVQPEIRPAVLREINRQLSRSPLGRSTGRPISVGDS